MNSTDNPASRPSAPALLPGMILAERYELLRELGRGGMGTVWAARHVVTKRTVALKLLHERRAHDPAATERLLREARASCAATHPTILPVDDVLTLDDGRHALVMALLEGESLRARLDREGALSLTDTKVIARAIVQGLAAAHAAGIVHRDLKPDNVFLSTGEPKVRLLDFGIAQSQLEQASGLTSTGAMLGTPYYMSPELAFGEGTKGGASDVWSLGVVLYECLTGKRPTQAPNLGQVLKLLSDDRLPKLVATAPTLPRSLARSVDQMLSVDPALRPSLDDVARALSDEVAEGEPSVVRPPGASSRSGVRMAALAVVVVLGIGGLWKGLQRKSIEDRGPELVHSAQMSAPETPLVTPTVRPPSTLALTEASGTNAPTAPRTTPTTTKAVPAASSISNPTASPANAQTSSVPSAPNTHVIVEKPPF